MIDKHRKLGTKGMEVERENIRMQTGQKPERVGFIRAQFMCYIE